MLEISRQDICWIELVTHPDRMRFLDETKEILWVLLDKWSVLTRWYISQKGKIWLITTPRRLQTIVDRIRDLSSTPNGWKEAIRLLIYISIYIGMDSEDFISVVNVLNYLSKRLDYKKFKALIEFDFLYINKNWEFNIIWFKKLVNIIDKLFSSRIYQENPIFVQSIIKDTFDMYKSNIDYFIDVIDTLIMFSDIWVAEKLISNIYIILLELHVQFRDRFIKYRDKIYQTYNNKKAWSVAWNILLSCYVIYVNDENQFKRIITIIQNLSDKFWSDIWIQIIKFLDSLKINPQTFEQKINKRRILFDYLDKVRFFEQISFEEYLDLYLNYGKVDAEKHLDNLMSKAKNLHSNPWLQNDRYYQFFIRYVYGKCDFSDYNINESCWDKTIHLTDKKFNRSWYSKLLWRKVDKILWKWLRINGDLYARIMKRLTYMVNFISKHIVDWRLNKQSLVNDYFVSFDDLYNKNVHKLFKGLFFSWQSKEQLWKNFYTKIYVLILSEFMRRFESLKLFSESFKFNMVIIDLMVLYTILYDNLDYYEWDDHRQRYFVDDVDDIVNIESTNMKAYFLFTKAIELYGWNLSRFFFEDVLNIVRSGDKYEQINNIYYQAIVWNMNFRLSTRLNDDINQIINWTNSLNILIKQLSKFFLKNIFRWIHIDETQRKQIIDSTEFISKKISTVPIIFNIQQSFLLNQRIILTAVQRKQIIDLIISNKKIWNIINNVTDIVIKWEWSNIRKEKVKRLFEVVTDIKGVFIKKIRQAIDEMFSGYSFSSNQRSAILDFVISMRNKKIEIDKFIILNKLNISEDVFKNKLEQLYWFLLDKYVDIIKFAHKKETGNSNDEYLNVFIKEINTRTDEWYFYDIHDLLDSMTKEISKFIVNSYFWDQVANFKLKLREWLSIDDLKVLWWKITINDVYELIPDIYKLIYEFWTDISVNMMSIFRQERNAIKQEIDKFKKSKSIEAGEEIIWYFMKSWHSANARMTSYLCNAWDCDMWENPNYFEFVMFDKNTWKCVGVVMLIDVLLKNWKKYLYFFPTLLKSFLEKVDVYKFYDYLKTTMIWFVKDNNYEGVVVPVNDNDIPKMCTNQYWELVELIIASKLRNKDGKYVVIEFEKAVTLSDTAEWWLFAYKNWAIIRQK